MKTTRVYKKGKSYFYVEDLAERNARGRPVQKWHKLSPIADGEAAMHAALAAFLGQAPAGGNMPAWCQRCHLNYDAKHHAMNSNETRRKGKAVADLFVERGEPQEER